MKILADIAHRAVVGVLVALVLALFSIVWALASPQEAAGASKPAIVAVQPVPLAFMPALNIQFANEEGGGGGNFQCTENPPGYLIFWNGSNWEWTGKFC